MSVIGIIGGKAIESAIRSLYIEQDEIPELICLDRDFDRVDQPFNIIIINSEHGLDERIRGVTLADGNIFIINADRKKILKHILHRPGRIITYGFNPKACVTASSALPGTVQYCIQRKLPTFSGMLLDEQEFSVIIDDLSTGNVLAAVTAALVAGLEVECIQSGSIAGNIFKDKHLINTF